MSDSDLKTYLNKLSDEAIASLKNGQPEIAIKKFKKILSHHPHHPKILNLISISYHQTSNLEKALHYILKAIRSDPNEIGFYINLGNIHRELKNYSDSKKAYNEGLKINSNSSELLYNLGVLFVSQHKYDEAIKYYKESLKINPSNKFILDNLGNAYKEVAKFDQAIECYNKAINLDQDFSQAKFNLSLVLLLTNPSIAAWEKYEYRPIRNKEKKQKFKNFAKWDGSKLDNKSLLIYSEQGIGDNIQFARYIKLIEKENTRIILYINKNLEFLFNKISEADEIITEIDKIYDVDYCISIMSLPYIFRHNLTVPKPYNFFLSNDKLKKFK